jgi:hypothetical protein
MAAPAKTLATSHGSKVQLRRDWKYRVVDITKVPEEYLVPADERVQKGKLNAMAKKDKELAFVPGIEFYSEDGISSSTAR